MGIKHNNMVPNTHFHKVCQQDHIRTWFNQPARKKRRRQARQAKAAAIAPRPTAGLLRPVVHPPTIKYNYKLRQGRGFTFAELKEAGINRKEARTIGISVDHRRRNRCTESLQLNAQRLKEYKAKLIVFPRKKGKPKSGDADVAELDKAEQLKGPILPMPTIPDEAPVAITDEMKSFEAYHKVRMARADYRLFGIRQKNRFSKEGSKE
jgi:large subunit ribosomal protein L13e